MGIGDYICLTLRGGAPWGFSIEEGEGDTYRPFVVSQVQEGGRAFLDGVQEGDQVVSLNGEPCADLTLLQAHAIIETSIGCLQLLLKRCTSIPSEDYESEDAYCAERESSGEALESTTLHILSPKHRSQSPRELYISESQDEAYYGEMDSDAEFPREPQLLSTELHLPSSVHQRDREPVFRGNDEARRCFSPGDMVELQVSLSEQTLDDIGCTSLGSAYGIEGELSNKEASEVTHTATASHYVPCPVREPLSQHGVVLSSPSMLGQVEVALLQPAASGAGRGIQSGGGGVGGPRVTAVGSRNEEDEVGGHYEGVPRSVTVSFGIPTEEATPAEDQDSDSDSQGDQDKPNKHRARHARLRRSESLSEKQVKEAKSKCKRIALLLKAAPPNPNNKGVLMFKKHRQRAKKYTLVSYGTGEEEPEYGSEEDEDNEDETHAVEFTLVAPTDSESDTHLLTNANSSKGVLTINWDKGLLEIERNLNNQEEMECLPETKGKGALMFAQRRQRMDEISAEHEELRRQGIPVEGLVEAEKKQEVHSYIQSTNEGHAYMDVNIHQQTQHQQQYQQYQGQQYYEQQQQQQQQHYQQQQQYQYQQQQYEQQHYQQQQMYQQQLEYHQEQQQIQQYSANVNGTVHHQTNEMQSSFSNRTAKPFSAQNMVATPYSPAVSGTNQEAVGQGEQIASRDERISTPASRTGILLDTRKKVSGKPMFTFKEAPKVSPNPELLNLLNKSDKKMGFESGPEEDYLSLGAEACNFLQSPRVKHKIPPPVAPKPVINPNSPPWSAPIEMTNQDMAQCAENSVMTPAVAPTVDTTPAPEPEPISAPAPEPSPPSAVQEVSASITTEEQHAWSLREQESQQQSLQIKSAEDNVHMISATQPEPAPVTSWSTPQTQVQQQPPANTWHPAQAQFQEPPQSGSPPQPTWVTHQPSQPQPSTNNWPPQIQPTWNQPQEQAQAHPQTPWTQPQEQPPSQPQGQPPWAQPQEQPPSQPQVQPPWAQPQEQPSSQPQVQPPWAQPQEQPSSQPQVQPPWAHPPEQSSSQPPWAQSHEQPHIQQMQPTWGQPQEQMQQAQPPWAQPPSRDSQQQPPWMQQQKSQVQPPWVQQVQPESQPQPPWVQQPQHQAPQQAWPQTQAPGQPQPPWASPQPQQQQPSWPPSQTQSQPPWIQANQAQPPAQPQTNLNPWAPVLPQAQPQQSWPQHPPEHGQHPMNSWGPEQNQPQQQPSWVQPTPPQPAPQPNWQQSSAKSAPETPMNTWPPAQTQPQNTWAQPSQPVPGNVSTSIVNTRPSPKPWQPPQNRTPPPPPQRMSSFTIAQRETSPINPMATVLKTSSTGSSFEMPAVKGKGADMFAKRQSRMEKFVVDSETVEANKASRSTSPAASLPNEWKYTPNALGRSYSLSPPARVPSTGQQSLSASSSPKPSARVSTTPPARQTSWLEKGRKPPTPWEAASQHPLGLVDEAFTFQNLQQTLASNVRLAAQRKTLPGPPEDWKARVSYQAPKKTGSQTWSQSQSRSYSWAPLPSFVSPTKSTLLASGVSAGYRSLPRQWQPQRSVAEVNLGRSVSSSEYRRPLGTQTYKSVYSSNTWSWKR
ncbi:synaptopodin-2 isoform X2 [Sphaeramia orbicularis]|nr:synaptopodin-2-like isoform X2 [Sphaeramia orbicularis]